MFISVCVCVRGRKRAEDCMEQGEWIRLSGSSVIQVNE